MFLTSSITVQSLVPKISILAPAGKTALDQKMIDTF